MGNPREGKGTHELQLRWYSWRHMLETRFLKISFIYKKWGAVEKSI